MASPDPESQIDPLRHQDEPSIPSFPGADPNEVLERNNNQERDQQQADHQHDSYVSHVDETQFESIEADTQFGIEVDNGEAEQPSSPSLDRDQQQLESQIPEVLPVVSNHPVKLFQRPEVESIDNLRKAFQFQPAPKYSADRNARPLPPTAVAAPPQSVARQPSSVNNPPNPNIPLPPKALVTVQSDNSRALMIPHKSPLAKVINEKMINGNPHAVESRTQEPPQQFATIPAVAEDSRVLNVAPPNVRSAQKSSNRNHKRFKKPFPDVARPPRAQRSSDNFANMPDGNSSDNGSPLSHANNYTRSTHNRDFSSNVPGTHQRLNQRNPSSVLESQNENELQMSTKPQDARAFQQQATFTHSNRMSGDPSHVASPARSVNEQDISSKTAGLPSNPRQADNLDNSEASKADADTIEHGNVYYGDEHEPSGQLRPEIEQNGSEVPQQANLEAAGSDGVDGNHQEQSIPSQVPFRDSSATPSRPQSRRSNCGKPMTRPIPPQDLLPQGVGDLGPPVHHSSKIAKSPHTADRFPPTHARPPSQLGANQKECHNLRPSSEFFNDYRSWFTQGQQIVSAMEDHEQQRQRLEAQEAEIQALKDTGAASVKQIQGLEEEKVALTKKLQEFTEVSSKYKQHMNQVVKAQKALKQEAIALQTNTAELKREVSVHKKEVGEVLSEKAVIGKKFEGMVKDAKRLREWSTRLDGKVSKQLKDVESANENIRSENEKLKQSAEKLQRDNETLKEEKNKLGVNAGAAEKSRLQIGHELDKTLIELSSEKNLRDEVQKRVETQKECHKELLELLKQTPKEVVEELSKEDSVLTRILSSEKTIESKIENTTTIINSIKDQQPEISTSLTKILENFFQKFTNEKPPSDNSETVFQDLINKVSADLKETINQLQLDKETEIRFNNQMAELRQTNEALVIDKNTREHELQAATKQVNDLKQDLVECRGQLGAKKDELAAALATPKEDPRLRAQIQDLEIAANSATSQLEASNQELAKVKEELSSLQESTQRTDQQIKDCEQKLSDAHSRIKILNEEKGKCLANKQQEIDKACQEARQSIAKSAETSKANLKSKFQSEKNQLDQVVKEKEAELILVKGELRKLQEGSDENQSTANRLQEEVAQYHDRFMQQVTQLQNMQKQQMGLEDSDRHAERLESAHSEVRQLWKEIESLKSENSYKIEVALRDQRRVEDALRNSDALEKANEKLRARVRELEKQFETSNKPIIRPAAPAVNTPRDEQPLTGNIGNLLSETPQPVIRTRSQTQNLTIYGSSVANDHELHSFANHQPLGTESFSTTENALRKAVKSVGSVSSRSQTDLASNASMLEQVTTAGSSHGRAHYIPHTEHKGGSRERRTSARKHSKFGQTYPTISRPHDPNQAFRAAHRSHPDLSNIDVPIIPPSSGRTPFSAVTSSIPTSSPLTDLSALVDELYAGTEIQPKDQEERQNSKGNMTTGVRATPATSASAEGPYPFTQHTMKSMNQDQEVAAKVRKEAQIKGHGDQVSRAQEVQDRRTKQPKKSAMKKPTNANAKPSDGGVPTSSTTFATSSVAHPAKSMVPPPALRQKPVNFQNEHRGAYSQVVNGNKPQTSTGEASHFVHNLPHETSSKTAKVQKSPLPNLPPSRNHNGANGKRAAFSVLESPKPSKAIRIARERRFGNDYVVPDSQDP